MPLFQPAPNFNFTVSMWDADASLLGQIAGAVVSAILGGFQEVQGLQAEFDVDSYNEGGRNDSPHRFLKWTKYPNLVFKSGVTFNPSLWDWYRGNATGTGKRTRKNGIIMLMDRGGPNLVGAGLPGLDRIPVAAWTFTNGYPEKLQGPGLNARGNEIAIETLEISHEGLERVSPTMIPGGVGDFAASVGI